MQPTCFFRGFLEVFYPSQGESSQYVLQILLSTLLQSYFLIHPVPPCEGFCVLSKWNFLILTNVCVLTALLLCQGSFLQSHCFCFSSSCSSYFSLFLKTTIIYFQLIKQKSKTLIQSYKIFFLRMN